MEKRHKRSEAGRPVARNPKPELPADGLLCIQLSGAAELEGCGPVLEFDETVLTVKAGKRLVKFYGTGLEIEVLRKKRIRIRGQLQRVEFEPAQEKP